VAELAENLMLLANSGGAEQGGKQRPCRHRNGIFFPLYSGELITQMTDRASRAPGLTGILIC
jgi:hypothetical protein